MSVTVDGFKSSPILEEINTTIDNNSKLRKSIIKQSNSKFGFNIKNNKGQSRFWVLDLKENGNIRLVENYNADDSIEKVDSTISISDANFKKLLLSKTSSQKLFMTGKLKISGNMVKAAGVEKILHGLYPSPKAKL
ncbi:SCP2 sterol-binding domain-containing protein [Ascoidea rubescens DSM 1968]|uniref:Putative oleate-induced peroxisomal protein n=1 Tax=Ascoidea rubescens DSM 1968 TaxID=1344418 RepID=A0A1D2VH92_9ASCO|nr:putative oleate-induced peroxisomal protein [Ascoidea rubescens DSM 1968]ODV61028.1 putative oleate-induced peroxisomal protein [Ascoidea rubescens DSM 1968]